MRSQETIRSRANPAYKRFRALRERGSEHALCLLEGPKLVQEALSANLVIVEAAAGPRAELTSVGREALSALDRRGVDVHAMSADLVASLSDAEAPQGLVALARRPQFHEDRLFEGTALVLVVDAVQNPGNVGALLRTAEAAGASGAYLTAGCADPFSWKALRGSMGSAFRLPHVSGVSLPLALERVESRGLAVVATAADGERRYDEADLQQPCAIVVGSEGAGLPAEIQARAQARLRIPLCPPVESLNVGVAAALVLYEAARQRGFPQRGGAQ